MAASVDQPVTAATHTHLYIRKIAFAINKVWLFLVCFFFIPLICPKGRWKSGFVRTWTISRGVKVSKQGVGRDGAGGQRWTLGLSAWRVSPACRVANLKSWRHEGWPRDKRLWLPVKLTPSLAISCPVTKKRLRTPNPWSPLAYRGG